MFTQTLLNGTSSTNSWEFKSALAGLTQGTSTTTRVGARIALVAIEYFVKIAPAVASVGGEVRCVEWFSTIIRQLQAPSQM